VAKGFSPPRIPLYKYRLHCSYSYYMCLASRLRSARPESSSSPKAFDLQQIGRVRTRVWTWDRMLEQLDYRVRQNYHGFCAGSQSRQNCSRSGVAVRGVNFCSSPSSITTWSSSAALGH
jgi:hypothetical protein